MSEAASKQMRAPEAILAVENLEGWYGEGQVLHGITFDVQPGQVVTLLGRNGAGKTTTLRALIGILAKRRGSIRFDGVETIAMPSRHIARLGLGYVPEERGIFASLSTFENLMLPPRVKPGGLSVEQIYTLFPNLKERAGSPGTKLSGGEQQMLAIGRILRTGAKTILLDEPTEGLAPVIVQQIGRTIARLKQEGYTIVLVEQNFRFAQTVADKHVVIEQGRVVDTIMNADFEASLGKITAYLGVEVTRL
jgi:branched-chain amino acid transport system ATP-binding protein